MKFHEHSTDDIADQKKDDGKEERSETWILTDGRCSL